MIKKTANQDLTAYNTFRMRVKCHTFIEYDSVADLIDIDFDTLPKPVSTSAAEATCFSAEISAEQFFIPP